MANPYDQFDPNPYDQFDEQRQSAPVTAFAGGFNRALSQYTEAPERIGIMAQDLLQLRRPNWQGTAERASITNFLRQSTPAPQTQGEQFASRIGQEAGVNLPYMAMTLRGAPAVAQAARPIPNAVAQSISKFAEGIKNAPLTAAIGEMLSVFGAGTGAATANILAPGNQTAEMTGQLIGGMAPVVGAYAPASLATRAAVEATRRFSPEAQTRRAMETVSDVIGPELGERARAGLRTGEQLRANIPGYEPSLAEATGSPSLIATQRAIESQAAGPDLERFIGRREANQTAIQRYAEEMRPEGAGPSYVIDTANRQIKALRQDIGTAQQATARQTGELAQLPTADLPGIGAGFRATISDARSAARQEMNTLARDLGINNVDASVPFREFQDRVKTNLMPQSAFEDAANRPAVAREILEYTSPPKNAPVVTFNDIMGLKSRVSDDLRDALSSANPSARKVRYLKVIEQEIDQLIDNAAQTIQDPTLADRYSQFRRAYKEQYIDRFNQGATFKVRARNGQGYYQLPDERVAEQFVKDVAGARQFKRTFGADAPETAALESVLLDDLRTSAVRDGKLNPQLVETWLRRKAPVLNEFPEIQAKVGTRAQLNEALQARAQTLTERERRIDRTLLNKEIQSFVQGGRTAEDVIAEAVQNPRLMRQISSAARRDPGAMAALRRSIWDQAADMDPTALRLFVNRDTVSQVLSKEHRDALTNIAAAMEQTARVPAPSGRAFDPSGLEDIERRLGSGVNQISSRIFAAQSGRTSWRYIGLDIASRFLRGNSRNEIAKILEGALYDPSVARNLADMIRLPEQRPVAAKRLNTWLLNVGAAEDREQ